MRKAKSTNEIIDKYRDGELSREEVAEIINGIEKGAYELDENLSLQDMIYFGSLEGVNAEQLGMIESLEGAELSAYVKRQKELEMYTPDQLEQLTGIVLGIDIGLGHTSNVQKYLDDLVQEEKIADLERDMYALLKEKTNDFQHVSFQTVNLEEAIIEIREKRDELKETSINIDSYEDAMRDVVDRISAENQYKAEHNGVEQLSDENTYSVESDTSLERDGSEVELDSLEDEAEMDL